jgi:catechol 2,3-dioxygenase-like lactoylglutathione lyase family enzyme
MSAWLALAATGVVCASAIVARTTAQAPRLFRVIVPVTDIERAAAFYEALLHLRGVRVSGGRHYLDAGGVILALYDPGADGDQAQPRPNFEHLYFAVPDLEAVYERAATLGGLSSVRGDGGLPMGEIARRPWGERSFYMNDPFGNPLCFVDRKTLFTGG